MVPNPAFPEHTVPAWLTDLERNLWDAACCRDLSVSGNIAVSLHEFRTKGKTKRPRTLTPEQRDRETAASEMIGSMSRLLFAGRDLLMLLAKERRTVHYLRLGQEPPELPAEPSAS